MLEKVDCTSPRGEVLTLLLEDISSGIIVKEIEGLDPVKANIVSSSHANQHGSQYQSSRRESRNLIFKLGLDPQDGFQTVRGLRRQIYNFFMPDTEVGLRFHLTDGLVVDISGRIETCETPIFAKESDVHISILCFDSDFVDPNVVEFVGYSTPDETEMMIDYEGDVETGVLLTVNIDRSDVDDLTFFCRPGSDEEEMLRFDGPLATGDVLEISTIPGAKRATRNRGGTIANVLYGVSPFSKWIELRKGINYVRLQTEGAGLRYTVEYNNRYGGL